jgi:hypothetical protein
MVGSCDKLAGVPRPWPASHPQSNTNLMTSSSQYRHIPLRRLLRDSLKRLYFAIYKLGIRLGVHILPAPRAWKGRTSSRRFYWRRRKGYWPWIAMNGGRCRDANLPSEPLMRRADAIAIIECGGTQTLAAPSRSARTIRATISGNLTVERQWRICAAFEGSPSEHMISLDRAREES